MLLGVFQRYWSKLLLGDGQSSLAKEHLGYCEIFCAFEQEQIRQSMFCIEPGGDPSLVLPFSPPAANWGPVELNANYNQPAALQNWLSMPGSSILGLIVLKGPTLCCVYPEMYFKVNHSVSIPHICHRHHRRCLCKKIYPV